MSLLKVATLLAKRLGNRLDLLDDCKDEIRQAQTELEHTPSYPWFLTRGWYPNIDVQDNALPEDFISIVEDSLFIVEPTGGPAYDKPKKLAVGSWGTYMTGVGKLAEPEAVAFYEERMWFFPVPDKRYALRMLYYGRQSELFDDAATNMWTKHAPDVLIAHAGYQMANTIRDAARAATFAEDKRSSRARMAMETVERLDGIRTALLGMESD